MLEASNFSVCNDSEQTYYNISHPIYWDFVDSIPTYYGQGYLFSLILWTETVDTIIRVMDRPEFGYLVQQILLSESWTSLNLATFVLYILLFRPSNRPDLHCYLCGRTIPKVSFNIRQENILYKCEISYNFCPNGPTLLTGNVSHGKFILHIFQQDKSGIKQIMLNKKTKEMTLWH